MKKILLIGPEVTDFLNPLANKLKNLAYTIDLLEIRKIPRSSVSITKSYSNILNFNEIVGKRITTLKVLTYLFKIDFYIDWLNTIFFNYLEGKSRIFKSLRNSLAGQHSKEIFSTIFKGYDIINFHSLTPTTLSYIKSITPEKKIILSFWGSDIFQIWGWEIYQKDKYRDYYVELEAMRRADIITVHSYEMERAVIAKFGPEIKNKIVRALFGMSDKIFDAMDEAKQKLPHLDFLLKYDIPDSKIKITIGYCGDPICNHLPVLEEIDKIGVRTKEKIHLLIPMTYGTYSEEYKLKVKEMLNQVNISYTLFDKFLSLDELVKLRISSDVMIQMSKSDALSSSVCEYLYANNILISAIWLPYSSLRSEKIFFYETDFLGLDETVTRAVDNYSQIQVNLSNNPEKIKKLNGFSNTWQKWNSLLQSLQ